MVHLKSHNRPKGQKSKRPVHGWVIVDKPAGVTSTQVVGRVRRAFNAQKAGHGGTLDPFATGVLPIALGEATKTMSYALDGVKSYRFTLCFGTATDTGDPTGQVVATSDTIPLQHQIRQIIPKFTGIITQMPPKYSALKVQGQRAYDLIRAGVDFTLKTRTVNIYDLSLTHCINENNYVFECTVSKGTYIRTLGADMALALGSVGHISTLRRTAVANFTADRAISLDILDKMVQKDTGFNGTDVLHPLHAVLDGIPVLAVHADLAQRLMHGQRLTQADVLESDFSCVSPNNQDGTLGQTLGRFPRDFLGKLPNDTADCPSQIPTNSPLLVCHVDGTPLALAEWILNRANNRILQPVRLFHLTVAES